MTIQYAATDIVVNHDVECTTRDGVILRADIYRPEPTREPLPILLTRTPYNKAMPLNANTCLELARRGYIAVTQDIRGTHASNGDYRWKWDPVSQKGEGEDGYDAVEWAARLPGSDGRVGTFGVSYMSHCSWSLAVEAPPSLKSMHVGGITANSLDMTFGIFDTGRRLQWIYAQAADQRKRGGRKDGPQTREAANAEWMTALNGKWIWNLPLNSIPDHVFDSLSQPYRDFLERPHMSVVDYGDVHQRLDIPVCTVTGWWDRLSLCVKHHELLQDTAPPEMRQAHRLLIGPWSHDPATARRDIGPKDYGPRADYPYPDQVADWYDEVFKGAPRVKQTGNDTVSLFVLNENKWRSFDHWPPRETREVEYFLHSGGAANSVHGDGRLNRTPPEQESADYYDYDPADPFMSVMGSNSHNLPVDQGVNDHRMDNLVYISDPLDEDLLVAGYPRCEFRASSSAPDTDFAVKLVEVGEDGLAINIAQGIIRARYLGGYDLHTTLESDTFYQFCITLMPTGIRFRRGSRIRFDIASSDFPAFDRNHNTGGRDWAETTFRVARQTIRHDSVYPARLILPVLKTP